MLGSGCVLVLVVVAVEGLYGVPLVVVFLELVFYLVGLPALFSGGPNS